MARLGVIVGRDVRDVDVLVQAPEGTVIISACAKALAWAAEEGLQHEEVPGNKVVALSDGILAIGTDGDEEVAAAVRRARAEGKQVEEVTVGEGAAL